MNYPTDRWEVQVIDDSDAATAADIHATVERYAKKGVPITYLGRLSRVGFKAGALNYGLLHTSAELAAVFDADHFPRPDFLRKTVPFFRDQKVGAVQARWDYRNSTSSPLTFIQAAVFDSFIFVEQIVRSASGFPVLFLGTDCVWRREAIESIGGWKEFPFTAEDFDLAYRANSRGWKILYQKEVLADCEMIESFAGYKAQQRRWAAAVSKAVWDNWRALLQGSHGLRAGILEVSFILLQIEIVALIMLIPLLLIANAAYFDRLALWPHLNLFLTVMLLISATHIKMAVSQKALHGKWNLIRLQTGMPYAIGAGLSMLAGFWENITHKSRGFTRTEKSPDMNNKHSARPIRKIGWLIVCEFVFAIISLSGLIISIKNHTFESLALWLCFLVIFVQCSITSLLEYKRAR